jgi:excisionase family DNA binding protein
MTSAEAAALLGVTVRQVQRLARSGQLTVRDTVGRAVLLDSASVLRLAQIGIAQGRKWNPSTVWTALAFLDGPDHESGADHESREGDQALVAAGIAPLDSSQRWHLRARLRRMRSEDLVRMSGRRATVTNWRVAASYAQDLRVALVLTGAGALGHSRETAARFGLAGGGGAGAIDGYTTSEQLALLQRTLFLAPAVDGNATLRVLPNDIGTTATRPSAWVASTAVIALDLADSLDVRERTAGLRVLRELMDKL